MPHQATHVITHYVLPFSLLAFGTYSVTSWMSLFANGLQSVCSAILRHTNGYCRVAPETLTQYQAHVKRLKNALAQPEEAAFARENSQADSADAADVVRHVEEKLVGQAASQAQDTTSEVPVPHRPALQPAVPNSTRCVHKCNQSVLLLAHLMRASKWHTSLQRNCCMLMTPATSRSTAQGISAAAT